MIFAIYYTYSTFRGYKYDYKCLNTDNIGLRFYLKFII